MFTFLFYRETYLFVTNWNNYCFRFQKDAILPEVSGVPEQTQQTFVGLLVVWKTSWRHPGDQQNIYCDPYLTNIYLTDLRQIQNKFKIHLSEPNNFYIHRIFKLWSKVIFSQRDQIHAQKYLFNLRVSEIVTALAEEIRIGSSKVSKTLQKLDISLDVSLKYKKKYCYKFVLVLVCNKSLL